MAVNEKAVYAVDHTTHGGRYFKPGDRMDERVPEYVLRSALEGGVASDSSAAAEKARKAEAERVARVNEEIATRSEKREHNERRAGNIPQLVRMPDGSLREIA